MTRPSEPSIDVSQGPLPLPAIVAALFLLWAFHGPFLLAPLHASEWSVLAASDGSSRALWPGELLWRAEVRACQENATAHRLVGLLLETSIWLFLVLAVGRRRNLGVAALLATAFLLHPAHTEMSCRLSLRPVLFSEWLLALGVVFWRRRSSLTDLVAPACLFGGALGLPAVSLLALPTVLFASSHGRGWLLASALIVGGVVGAWHGPAATLSMASSLAAADGLVRPDQLGLTLAVSGSSWTGLAVLVGLLGLLVACSPQGGRDRGTALAAAALLSVVLVAVLRPQRLDQGRLGATLTADSLVAGVAVLTWLCGWMADRSWKKMLAVVLVAAVLWPGWRQARLAQDEQGLLEQAVALAPDQAEFRFLLAEAQLVEALQMRDQQIDSDWHRPAEKALRNVEYALRTQSGLQEGRLLRCRIYLVLGDVDLAREESKVLLAENPSFLPALLLRAELELASQQPLEALSWLRAARNHPQREQAEGPYQAVLQELMGLIQRAIESRQPDQARYWCEKLLRIAPEEHDVRIALAHSYIMQGKPERALDELSAVLEQAPDHILAIRAKVVIHEQLGNSTESQQLRQRLLQLGDLPTR
jgi:tetratricopeptide (TPR) repeat protein